MTSTPPEAPLGPPPAPAGDTGPRVGRDQVRDLGRLRRSRTDRKVAGVAGGLGRHLDVDPLVLRVAFVVLAFFGGAGLILYGACWLLVPEDGDDRAPLNLDERSRTVALVIVGILAALALVGDSWGAFWFPWPLALVALVALWLLTRNHPPTTPPPPGWTAPPAYGAGPVAPAGQEPAPTAPAPGQAPDASAPHAVPYSAPYTAAPADPYATPSAPPAYAPPVTWAPKPPNPRKRGPILFWFTLALLALAEGLLGMADLAGVDVAASAYPALAVGICGLMLLVGSFYGRAGGVIALGLASALALTVSTAADRIEGDGVREVPTSASQVDQRYWLGAGEQVIDLRQVSDLQSLDGRRLEVEGGIGRIEVILPEGLAATVSADVNGFGHLDVFGFERGGVDIHKNSFEGSPDDPSITIDARMGVGEIEVSHR